MNADGGSRGNPGRAAIGIVIRENEKVIEKHKERIGITTNNVAEYNALIKALELAAKHTKKEIFVFMDSEFVVRQVKGEYKVRKKHLMPLFEKVKEREKVFESVKYEHVPRENKFQALADELVNEALDEC